MLPLLAIAGPDVIVYNASQGTVLEGPLQSREASIASISKLMTVYTVLQDQQDLDELLTISNNRKLSNRLTKGMRIKREDLIKLALVSSDNLASITLAEHYPGGTVMFVKKMNEHAKTLNMEHTRFVEPSGLNPMNYSTLHDIVQLTNAVSQYSIVNTAAQTKLVTVNTATGKRNILIKGNPTSIFFGSEGLVAIKTGFTKAAGFCITMALTANNQRFNIVVLGAPNTQERNKLIEKALRTVYNA